MTEDTTIQDYEELDLGDFHLQEGATLRKAKLAYKQHGEMNQDKSNVILFPTFFSGTHQDDEHMIGEGMALDPAKYCILQVNQLGNGLSSSPSNYPEPYNQGKFPVITTLDNVRAQYQLVADHFHIDQLEMICGYSMGAQQTFQWAAAYPEKMRKIVPWCGTASTTPHNYVFLEGVKSAITTDAQWQQGFYESHPHEGLRAVGRVYAGWGLSQQFYYEQRYLDHGFSSLEDFLVGFWEAFFLQKDANNLLSMAHTWQRADIARTEGCHSREEALNRITAKALVMPCETDLYFRREDVEREVACMTDAECRPIPSIYGHFAGIGFHEEDTAFINQGIKELLEAPAD